MVVRIAGQSSRPARIDPSIYLSSSDESLMQMFQAGDDLAFHALLERHVGLLWRVAKNYFGAAAEIDDLVQDLHLTLWQNKHAWKPGVARFSTWLYRVAANRCIDLLRKRQEPGAGTGAELLPDQMLARDPSAEDQIVRRQQAEEMKILLEALPENQKIALQLYYYEDASLPQIAGRLAISEMAARSLLKRGKQGLREKLSA